MWKDYSLSYIKNNRLSGISVMITAFITALLLSLLCGLFYNLWKYEVERIELEEGGWQSQITGKFNKEDIELIKNFVSVKNAVVNEKETNSKQIVIDIYFDNMWTVLQDTPKIAKLVKVAPETVVYNYELLAMYLIRAPQDTAPRLLFPIFILIMTMASLSLIIIIHNSFAISMNTRIYQFGIFSSIGATPKQIKVCLLQEAAALCALPVLSGNLLGIVTCMVVLQIVNVLASGIENRHNMVFGYHPLVFMLTLFVTVITVWISAWLPARKLSRLTPLEAIKNTEELQLKYKKKYSLLTFLFGIKGELAGNALKAQQKALRTASLSLLLSFMAFTIMQCFFTMTKISTRETYFERYQDTWDIMVTVNDAKIDLFEELEEIQGLSEVESAVMYQKATAKRIISEEEISKDMKSFGGFSHASDNYVTKYNNEWLVNAPIIILDDNSFLDYCKQIGITPKLDGAVILNQIRDVTNKDFRHPKYMPYIQEESATTVLRCSDNEKITTEISVLSYTEKVPVLREEYATLDYYELVHFIPVSLWKKIKMQIKTAEDNVYIRVLSRKDATLATLKTLQNEIEKLIRHKYNLKSENRIQEYNDNNKQLHGMMAILSGFCVLLAIIGISNVFSNTLGFVRQRKREFVRYMSVGMTPEEIKKIFYIEALVIAGRPVLFSIFPTIILMLYMLKISYLEVGEFLAEAPLFPIVIFMFAIFGFVALAYYLGWCNVSKINLVETLKNDTMM